MRRIRFEFLRGKNETKTETCDICGKQGNGTEVPYGLNYWPETGDSWRDSKRAFRCKQHAPGEAEGDKREIQDN